MDWPDVQSLKSFYARRLGALTQQYVQSHIEPIAEKCSRHNILGLGYAMPYLPLFQEKKNHVVAVTPANEGGICWPSMAACQTAVAEELELPFANNSIDFVLLVHTLEHSEQPILLMHEIWRILAASGQVMIVVPNRKGMWARSENTPFGSGKPYNKQQMLQLLEHTNFAEISVNSCLYMPACENIFARPHHVWEAVGGKLAPAHGGLLLAHAKKQVYVMDKISVRQPYAKPKPFVPAVS